jgi:pimeloyl-ACP methyl ester carboxylesterase
MPYVHTPGLDIHYQEAGEGPNVFLLVHGNFGSWRWWDGLLQALPPGFRAYAPDLRGCGDTAGGASPETFEIAQLAGDLRAFADALGLRAFHLVGHSLGGAVALQFALDEPRRVRTLTLVTPAPATGLVALREGSSASARMLRLPIPSTAPRWRCCTRAIACTTRSGRTGCGCAGRSRG